MSNFNNQEQPDPSSEDQEPAAPTQGAKRQPVFNLPGIIVTLIGVLTLIHLARTYVLGLQLDAMVIAAFAFIPASYSQLASQLPFPASGWWSPLTHSFLHVDWTHLVINLLWLTAFGSPLARRIGTGRFLVLSAICAIAGALFHYLSHPGQLLPMIGASGAVSGYFGAAGRFAFNNMRRGSGLLPHGRALSLKESLSNRQFLTFSIVWLGLNYVLGSGIVPFAGEGVAIAWQAHVGGFLAGVLLFSLFDRKVDRANP